MLLKKKEALYGTTVAVCRGIGRLPVCLTTVDFLIELEWKYS